MVESIPVPVVIAGGPKSKTDLDILQMTEDAMVAGAKGVTYGRNIFAHKSPDKMVEALAGIIEVLEKAGELKRISTEVDSELELAEILRRTSWWNTITKNDCHI